MRQVIRFFGILAMVFLLAFAVCAKETVVYENDFAKNDLSDLALQGNWQVVDGKLTTGEGSGSAFLTFDIPEKYAGMPYQIDVDFLSHTSTGGIQIGAAADALSETPVNFFGFSCFTGNAGTKAALGCYKADGSWSGNIAVSDAVVPLGDIHLSVRVDGNMLIYNVTSPDGETSYYGIEYTIGQAERDIYNAFSDTVGLRKFYVDKGYFDNFRVTVYEDDVLPSMSKKIDFDGVSFRAGGVSKSGRTVKGSGAMLTDSAMAANFTASVMLTPVGVSKLLFGMTDAENGYAFEIHKKDETVALYKITDGAYTCMGRKKTPVGDDSYLASVSVHNSIATATFDAFSQGKAAFPSFEMALDGYAAGKFGIWLEGGSVQTLTVSDSVAKQGDMYTNPVASGADPDVLYYDGTYYLYNRIKSGNNVFQVYTSPDLVNWTERNVVFTHKPGEYTAKSYMSPNVFYYDGTFYLFYAAKNPEGKNRLFCASSDSPYGPFEHKNGQTPLHDVSEIGGHPYLDESGKVYLTYVRFGNGNHIWIEEVFLHDGSVTPVTGTLTKVISPTEAYENDGYGHISEGGVIYKHNGLYYMIYASGHYLGQYGEAYAVAENILGPYTKYAYNEILTANGHVNGVGDGIFVQSPDGGELWMVYHQHKSTTMVEPRQTCIDKVQFVKDPNGGPDILTVNGPTATPQKTPSFEGRYNINGDSKVSLADVMALAKRQAADLAYKAVYDLDGNGREDFMDLVKLLKIIAE